MKNKNNTLLQTFSAATLSLLTMVFPTVGAASIVKTASYRPNFDINVWADYGLGPVSGFEQIPLDGTPGTTSEREPTFSQLGINQTNLLEVGAVITIKQWLQVDASLQHFSMDSNAVLNNTLVSHGRVFDPGTFVTTSSDYNIYHLRLGPIWQIFPRMQLGANAGVALLQFNYKVASNDRNASRAFNHLSPEIGLNSNYQLTSSLAWQINGTVTIPTQFAEENISTSLHYYPQIKKYPHLSFFVKTGALFLQFKDKQQEPNRMHLNYGPYIALGISI